MRISNVQNLAVNAVNAMNKCCKPRKTNENNAAQNSLKPSPVQDTVSFGMLDKNYLNRYKKPYISDDLYSYLHDINRCTIIAESPFYTVTPTEETKKHPELKTYEVKILEQYDPDIIISHPSLKPNVNNAINKFNAICNLPDGWHKNLNSPEDFEHLIELDIMLTSAEDSTREAINEHQARARLADLNRIAGIGLPEVDDDDDDLNIFNMHDRGFSI